MKRNLDAIGICPDLGLILVFELLWLKINPNRCLTLLTLVFLFHNGCPRRGHDRSQQEQEIQKGETCELLLFFFSFVFRKEADRCFSLFPGSLGHG
jgi:hypothetical protein